MSSLKQIEANRRNALKVPDHRRRKANIFTLNALRHGLTARTVIANSKTQTITKPSVRLTV
jgi:hypothetical protein